MKTVLVCNQKGGVGKSLIADEIAFSMERSGIPMSFYDLDQQGGTLHEQKIVDEAEVAILDTPGALQKDLVNWLQMADIIIIPTRTTIRDVAPLMHVVDAVEKNAKRSAKIFYVLNGYNRFKSTKKFMEWFDSNKFNDTIITLPQAEAYPQAGVEGMSVIEYAPGSKAAESMKALVNEVREALGLEKE